jgi:hypothetical protein
MISTKIWTPLQVSSSASIEKLEKFGGTSSMERPGRSAELASIYVQLASSDKAIRPARPWTGQP